MNLTSESRRRGGVVRRTAADLAFLLPVLPIVIVGFTTTLTLFVAGVGLAIVWIGVPLVAVSLVCARWSGTFELGRLDRTGRPRIVPPRWSEPHVVGFLGWIKGTLGDPRYWAYLAHSVLVSLVLGVVTWSTALIWFTGAFGGLSYWFWVGYLPPRDGDNVWIHEVVLRFFDPSYVRADSIDGLVVAENLFFMAIGALCLLTLPPVVRLLVDAHWLVARGMLGEWRSAQLERDVAASEASRGAAVSAEDSSLRRLERDIHDGPQQRLLRLQYDLARAERRLDGDSSEARLLVAGALQQSKDALDELRDLSRGLAPPILQDRGLRAAINSAAARSIVPVSVSFELGGGEHTVAAVERSAYFIVAELLANVDKHAEATAAEVALRLEHASGETSLVIEVRDNGKGGAAIDAGHGLAGLRDRLAGLRGALLIDSPVGGPTSTTARIPVGGHTLEG